MVQESASATAGRKRQIPPGTRLGRYRIVKRIASGGMAEVYLASVDGPGGFSRPVAVKLVLPHLAEQNRFVRLFEQEGRIAAHLNHPNIVQVFELGYEDDELFLVMEFVDGRTLQSMLAAADGPLPLRCALSIMISTATAIHHAHEATNTEGQPLDLVHRDISPSNVMVRHDGQVKVVDFGIAKALTETSLTKTGSLKGKAGYMSPEQCRGAPLTRVSDVFNLGILLYELTTGRRAFGGSNIFEVMNRIVDGRYTSPDKILPDYPPQLARIVAKALALEPDQRHATALSLREDMDAFAVAHKIFPSDRPVAEWITRTFGPATQLDLGVAPTDTDEVRLEKSGFSLPGWARATLVGGLAGTAVFLLLRGGSSEPSPPLPKDPAAVAAPDRQPSPPAPETKTPTPSPTPSVDEDSTDPPPNPSKAAVEPTPTPTAATATPPPTASPSSADKRRKKSGARRATKKKSGRTKKKGGRSTNPDPLFPWEP